MPTTDKPVTHTARKAAVTTITISRPEARNALNVAVLTGMAEAMEAAEADGETQVIILTGGADTFSAGADIDMLSGQTAASYVTSPNRFGFERIRDSRLPVIAAVSGFCLGKRGERGSTLLISKKGSRDPNQCSGVKRVLRFSARLVKRKTLPLDENVH